MSAFRGFISKVLDRYDSVYYRFHSFEHASRALTEDSKFDYNQISNAISSEKVEDIDFELYLAILEWIREDSEFYLDQLKQELDKVMNDISFEDFNEIVNLPDYVLSSGPGGITPSNTEWMQILWNSDKREETEYLDGNVINFLVFSYDMEHKFCVEKSTEKYKREIFEDDIELANSIMLGALKFNFITNGNDYLNKFYNPS